MLENNMKEEDIKKLIQQETSRNFQKRIGDTPTDALQLVNRRYVNLNGTTASRPTASVATAGQQYFDITIGRPVYFNPNSSVWVDGAGSIS